MENTASLKHPGVRKIYNGLCTCTRFVSFLLAVAISVVVFMGVMARYVLKTSLTWSDEMAIWLFLWMICISIPNGHISDGHIYIDLYSSKLTPQLKLVRRFVLDFIIYLATFLMLSASYEYVQKIGGISVTLGVSNHWKVLPIPVCCFLSFLVMLLKDFEDRRVTLVHFAALVIAALAWIVTGYGKYMPRFNAQPSLIMMLIFFISVLLGAPISFSMMLATFTATSSANLLPGVAVIQNMVAGGGKFVLLAIPFFLISGYLMNIGGLSSRIMNFASTLVGRFTGGLAKVNILNSLMMGGISGSSGADAASTTKMIVPEMEKRGYDRDFACAVTAASAVLPNIIPPAITMLVCASVADVSVLGLFFGGIGPGVLIALLQMLVVQIVSKKRGYETKGEVYTLKECGSAFLKALPSLMLFVWIIGGIRMGIVTASEAGVIGMIWALFLGLVYKTYDLKTLFREIINSSVDAGLIGLLMAVSNPFAWVLIADHLPQQLIAWAASLSLNQHGLLLIVTLIMVILGTFIDVSVCILIATPLFLPLANMIGVDLVLFCIVMILGAVIGNITPPVGILVYITSGIANEKPTKVFKECVPFILSILAGILLVIYVPGICTGLVTLFGK